MAKSKDKTPKEKKTIGKVRLLANGAQLAIVARKGKKGFNVAATLRVPGSKSTSGSKSTHETAEAAMGEFTKLVDAAKGKGWEPKVKVKKASSAFTEIPAPPAAAPATTGPVAAAGGRKR